jgi:hypothetical protein
MMQCEDRANIEGLQQVIPFAHLKYSQIVCFYAALAD